MSQKPYQTKGGGAEAAELQNSPLVQDQAVLSKNLRNDGVFVASLFRSSGSLFTGGSNWHKGELTGGSE